MTWQLIVDGGRHKGKAIPIRRLPFLIGRGADCQLQPSAATVSRQHCPLTVRDGKLFVADCLTANGTFVNGERLIGEGELRPGDRLGIGPLTFVIDLVPEPLTPPLPVVDEDAVAAMLLELDLEAHATSAGSADGASDPEAETAREPALPDKNPPPAERASAPPPRVDSATAAEAILGQYLRRPEAAANWRRR
ncbi:MAG: FHA domain-containing protein [Gemmataceae bacterium]|nr:FHA domain-containing protein [Gemmataceae bacterium]